MKKIYNYRRACIKLRPTSCKSVKYKTYIHTNTHTDTHAHTNTYKHTYVHEHMHKHVRNDNEF